MNKSQQKPGGPVARDRWKEIANELHRLAEAVDVERLDQEEAVTRVVELTMREAAALTEGEPYRAEVRGRECWVLPVGAVTSGSFSGGGDDAPRGGASKQ